jgi:hypothetical protein
MKIEQSFGFLVNKWRVLKNPLEVNFRCVPSVVECCMHLHNYCINEREVEWAVTNIPDSGLADHVASYEEYFDEMDSACSTQCTGSHINVRSQVREA